jgi:hypothetical protein
MVDPASDIAAGSRLWKIFTRIRHALQQVEKFSDAILHVNALEKRVEELEKRLARCPAQGCPRCRELTFTVVSSKPAGAGKIARQMKCTACDFSEVWYIDA